MIMISKSLLSNADQLIFLNQFLLDGHFKENQNTVFF